MPLEGPNSSKIYRGGVADARSGGRAGCADLVRSHVVSACAVVEAMVHHGEVRVSAAQIIARLAAASQKLDEAKAKTAAAAQDAAEARALVAGALEGVAAGPLVGMIDSYRQALAQASQGGDPAKQHVQETIAKVRALGN